MPNADELRICVYTCNVVWVVLILGVLKDVASYMWKIMMEFCFGHVVNQEVSMITRGICYLRYFGERYKQIMSMLSEAFNLSRAL